MLKIYDPLDEVIEASYFSSFNTPKLRYYASDIMQRLGCNENDAVEALSRAIHACTSMRIPVAHHFHQVFRFDGQRLSTDWKLSSLACYLLVVNADPCNPAVARAQLYMFMRS